MVNNKVVRRPASASSHINLPSICFMDIQPPRTKSPTQLCFPWEGRVSSAGPCWHNHYGSNTMRASNTSEHLLPPLLHYLDDDKWYDCSTSPHPYQTSPAFGSTTRDLTNSDTWLRYVQKHVDQYRQPSFRCLWPVPKDGNKTHECGSLAPYPSAIRRHIEVTHFKIQ